MRYISLRYQTFIAINYKMFYDTSIKILNSTKMTISFINHLLLARLNRPKILLYPANNQHDDWNIDLLISSSILFSPALACSFAFSREEDISYLLFTSTSSELSCEVLFQVTKGIWRSTCVWCHSISFNCTDIDIDKYQHLMNHNIYKMFPIFNW